MRLKIFFDLLIVSLPEGEGLLSLFLRQKLISNRLIKLSTRFGFDVFVNVFVLRFSDSWHTLDDRFLSGFRYVSVFMYRDFSGQLPKNGDKIVIRTRWIIDLRYLFECQSFCWSMIANLVKISKFRYFSEAYYRVTKPLSGTFREIHFISFIHYLSSRTACRWSSLICHHFSFQPIHGFSFWNTNTYCNQVAHLTTRHDDASE